MTLGDLVMYIFFIGLVAAPLVSIASIGTQITEAFAGLDRIRELLDMTTEIDEDESRAAVETLQGDVRFEDIWFEYNPGQPVLRGVSFHAAPGTTTALVGSSGSGKSTRSALVMASTGRRRGHIIVDDVTR
jgi:subfamily B ATP-binding cassette protein MsbA